MVITTFGASSANSDLYLEAYKLGKKIGLANHILKNGGYGGTMEASAKGCSEVDGQVIGVGVAGHEIDGLKGPNKYNTEFIIKESVRERIYELLNTDLIIVLGGRLGTLEELFVAWMEDIEGSQTPIIIVGENFRKLIKYLVGNDFVQKNCLKYLIFIDSIDDLELDSRGQILFKQLYLINSQGRTIIYKGKTLEERRLIG